MTSSVPSTNHTLSSSTEPTPSEPPIKELKLNKMAQLKKSVAERHQQQQKHSPNEERPADDESVTILMNGEFDCTPSSKTSADEEMSPSILLNSNANNSSEGRFKLKGPVSADLAGAPTTRHGTVGMVSSAGRRGSLEKPLHCHEHEVLTSAQGPELGVGKNVSTTDIFISKSSLRVGEERGGVAMGTEEAWLRSSPPSNLELARLKRRRWSESDPGATVDESP